MDIGGERVAQGWACQMPGQDTTVQEAVTLCCVARHLPINVPPSTKEYNWVSVNCQGSCTKCYR